MTVPPKEALVASFFYLYKAVDLSIECGQPGDGKVVDP